MAALLAPTVNSYKRLRPGCFSGYWANWARDHRGTTVRVAAEQGKGARLEHRMADCTSNPYLATATVLQAARLGVTEGYELPPEETGDCFETVNTKRCVPEDLCAALVALESDQSLVDAVGQPIVDHLVYLKRVEWNKYLGHTTDWEIGHYFEFI
jgi:glutamine synthetase